MNSFMATDDDDERTRITIIIITNERNKKKNPIRESDILFDIIDFFFICFSVVSEVVLNIIVLSILFKKKNVNYNQAGFSHPQTYTNILI